MKYIHTPFNKKTIVFSLLALSLTFVNVNVSGWANTNNLQSEMKSATTQDSAQMDGKRSIVTPQESAKVFVDLPQLPKTVTILKPAVDSSFSEKKSGPKTAQSQERKKVGLALMFLGALADGGS